MVKKDFSKKRILLFTLVLTFILSACVSVSALTYDIRPLKVQINECLGVSGPTGSVNLGYEFHPSFTDYDGYIPGGNYYTKYSWDFGDGTYSNEAVPRHLYKNPGTYNVKLYIECLPVPGNPGEPLNMIMYRGETTKTIVTAR